MCSIRLIAQMIPPSIYRRIGELLIAQGRSYRIASELRAGMPKGTLAILSKAGICEMQIGIEALDTNLLKKMSKGTRLIDNLETMKFCEEVGIRYSGSNLLLDFPTESREDVDNTIEAIDYAAGYMPLRFSRFELDSGSPAYTDRKKYGILSVSDGTGFGRYLPKKVSAAISATRKHYRRKRKRCKHKGIIDRVERWKNSYVEARSSGRHLLYYMACKGFLRIEDAREGSRSITLRGVARKIYLFCDDIRGFDEIRRRFPDIDEGEMRRALKELLSLKLMYAEDDDWLSLAIRSSPENRRGMPFS